MIRNYKKYIFKKFLLSIGKVTLVFSSVVIIMNLFEEISFFRDSEEFILLPIYLTLLNMPSVLFEIFPFIFLIGTLFFFIEIIDKDEINILKLYGVTNLNIIQLLGLLTFAIGFFILIFFYNISSNLKFFYFVLKY